MDIALSLKIPEVIAVGRPLVTSRLSVLRRYFGEDALYMFEPGNVDECAQKLLQVYHHPQEVEKRIKLSQEALQGFAWDKQKEIYLKIISSITDDTGNSDLVNAWKPSHRMRIKRFLRRSVSFVSCYSGIAWLWYFLMARRGVRILTYHAVESLPGNSYAVSIENFRMQMSYLKEKYHVISFAEFQRYLREERPFPPDTLLLTFDDGFKSFYDNAYPILKRLQLPSICFLILEKMQGDDEDFLHLVEINELAKDGLMTFGSHTVSHRSLAHLNDEDLRHEVSISKKAIEQKLRVAIDIFSYPYGTRLDFDDRSVSALSAAGYKWACTSLNGINRKLVNPLKLFRTKIEWGDDFRTFRRILKGCLDVWFLIDLCLPFLQNRGEVDFQ